MKLYFDIDTQIDFMFPSGALYAPGAEKLLPLIATLNRAAGAGGGKVISSMCAHAENDPEFKTWPPHCVKGTVGQTKPRSLLVDNQIIVEKTELDIFSNPETEQIIKSLDPEECIVYGVVTEYCVKLCAMGLLDRGYKVCIVREAIQSLDAKVGDQFLEEFAARPGAGFCRLS